jgi:hypothetical protein
MRSVILMSLVACLVLMAGVANAAQPAGQVPNATLAQLGLGQMHQMTDVQGTTIRGSGFAAVGGWSWATSPTSGSGNSYVAVSTAKPALAAGASASVAASGSGVFTPWGNYGGVVGSVAFGGAVAYAR